MRQHFQILTIAVAAATPSCAYRTGEDGNGGRYAELTLGTDEQGAYTTPRGTGRADQNQSRGLKYVGTAIVSGIALNEAGNAVSTISNARTTRDIARHKTTLGIVTEKEATKQAADALNAGVETTKILNP